MDKAVRLLIPCQPLKPGARAATAEHRYCESGESGEGEGAVMNTVSYRREVSHTLHKSIAFHRGMKRFVKATFWATMFCALSQLCAYADVIAYYSFNATNAIADIGSAISTFSFHNSAGGSISFVDGTEQNVQPGFLAGCAISQDHWLEAEGTTFFQFTLDATGWRDLVVSYAWERSSIGPTFGVLQVASSSSSFVDVTTMLPVPASFTAGGGVVTQDLFGLLDGDSTAAFRIRGMGASQSDGVLHLDNFTVTAVAIPEPSAAILAGLGSATVFLLRKRRH